VEPFTRLTSVAAPLDQPNLDTDQIAPVRFLRRPREAGYADVLFRDLMERPDFILNRAEYRGARILVADRNFGGGSSREQAVWALCDYGIRCVIAPSFGDIFFNNCFRNGLLPVELPEPAVRALAAADAAPITVDLAAERVTAPDGAAHPFSTPPLLRRMLLEGLDEIALTLAREKEIAAFRAADRARRPWVYAPGQDR
jgi:3-isopropylmalate/(R)-2-methylmalate dehydratase small subunit